MDNKAECLWVRTGRKARKADIMVGVISDGGCQPLLTGAGGRIRENGLKLHHMGLDYISGESSSPKRVAKH